MVSSLFTIATVNDKSFTVRKLSRFSRIFIKPQKFSLLNFCSSESSDLYEGGDGKNRKTFPRIPDKPSKPRNFSPLKLLSFTVYDLCYRMLTRDCEQFGTLHFYNLYLYKSYKRLSILVFHTKLNCLLLSLNRLLCYSSYCYLPLPKIIDIDY